MSDEYPSILSHVSIGTNDFDKALAFYDRVLATVGCRRMMQHGDAVAYGKAYPEFWVNTPLDGQAAAVGNGSHFAFFASSKEQVDAFHKEGLAAGATDEGPPGPRPQYGDPYYGAFLRDLDGHKIEAAYWDMELAQKLGMM